MLSPYIFPFSFTCHLCQFFGSTVKDPVLKVGLAGVAPWPGEASQSEETCVSTS